MRLSYYIIDSMHMYYRSIVGNMPETVVEDEDEMEGKECLGVSKQYNIPGHSSPGPKCTCMA
jgi:hypothetical protein